MMRLMTLAAGLAVGYVLGTRAGREKYEQIVDNARQLYGNPTLDQAQQAVKNLTGTGRTAAPAATGTSDVSAPAPKPARRGTGAMN